MNYQPAEVGSLSQYLRGFSTISGGCLGFQPSTLYYPFLVDKNPWKILTIHRSSISSLFLNNSQTFPSAQVVTCGIGEVQVSMLKAFLFGLMVLCASDGFVQEDLRVNKNLACECLRKNKTSQQKRGPP